MGRSAPTRRVALDEPAVDVREVAPDDDPTVDVMLEEPPVDVVLDGPTVAGTVARSGVRTFTVAWDGLASGPVGAPVEAAVVPVAAAQAAAWAASVRLAAAYAEASVVTGSARARATSGLNGLIVPVRPTPPMKAPTMDSAVNGFDHCPYTSPLPTKPPTGDAITFVAPVVSARPANPGIT
ncbi:hypothetical protein ACFMQL_39075 [Nonomuraea fastidiosa]|uniref:hypothetical protein n=1 Tax=Nonomuraea TaxID=83681 RepID=UPI003670439F